MNITTCPNCGGRVRSETIGWKCESCQGFIDMRGEFHQHKEEPFMPPMTEDDLMQAAATALSTLQGENKRLNKIVCSIPTTPDSGRTVSQYDKEMPMCAYLDDLEAENEKLRAELERVKRERDAAVKDVAAIIGDVEEIRRGYGVDNADADGAFAELCETYCANKGRSCYAECEKYHCKNFKWRGQKED